MGACDLAFVKSGKWKMANMSPSIVKIYAQNVRPAKWPAEREQQQWREWGEPRKSHAGIYNIYMYISIEIEWVRWSNCVLMTL